MQLGAAGIWSSALRRADPGEAADAASELEELGFGALWIPGNDAAELTDRLGALLACTRNLVIATGIVSIWRVGAPELAAMRARFEAEFPGRFLLGVGVSHAPLVAEYARPLSTMRKYLDELDASGVPADARVIAALAPRMLETARDRARGAHPYLVTPAHTSWARDILGREALLAPEQTVLLNTERTSARDKARKMLEPYLRFPNYVKTFTARLGFDEDDVAHGGSDRLVDGLVAWGDDEDLARRIREHHAAGADHVPIQVVTDDPSTLPRREWRRLAAALGLGATR
jgi:probable F420-dependent oxidoreductase